MKKMRDATTRQNERDGIMALGRYLINMKAFEATEKIGFGRDPVSFFLKKPTATAKQESVLRQFSYETTGFWTKRWTKRVKKRVEIDQTKEIAGGKTSKGNSQLKVSSHNATRFKGTNINGRESGQTQTF
ncbi:unnamed protein product [Orchesella dallaii]|uniref:Uncharacterized protein n=1 Tax=Orchesella dallaii TaxID=48710 RepID=A0ABP1R519_9HEXA